MASTEAEIDRMVTVYRQAAYAESTKAIYRSHLKAFLSFCHKFGYLAVPASSATICRYAAWLSNTLVPSSVKQYLNIIKLLHLESGLENPLEDDWVLRTVLKGIQRVHGRSVCRKLPITVTHLHKIRSLLNLENQQDLAFWAACLVAFFGMLRKSSLFPRSLSKPHMLIQNCTLHQWGISITSSYSKTIQCDERQVYVALPWHSDPRLCPARTLIRLLYVRRGPVTPQSPLFAFTAGRKNHCLTYHTFTSMLKQVFSRAGMSLRQYSGHSFRRGGATYALQSGVPAEVIRAQGDWKSMSYLDYLEVSDRKNRAEMMSPMCE